MVAVGFGVAVYGGSGVFVGAELVGHTTAVQVGFPLGTGVFVGSPLAAACPVSRQTANGATTNSALEGLFDILAFGLGLVLGDGLCFGALLPGVKPCASLGIAIRHVLNDLIGHAAL